MTSDEHHLVCYDADKVKSHLYIHTMKTGNLVSKVMVKYNGFKEVTKIIALPDKPSVVALIDVDKGNLMDIIQRRFIKSIPCWDGTCSKVEKLSDFNDQEMMFRMVGMVSMLLQQEGWRCSILEQEKCAKLSFRKWPKAFLT